MEIICDNCCEERRRPRQGKYNHPLLKYTDAAEAELITALTINFYQTPFKARAVLCGNELQGGILPLPPDPQFLPTFTQYTSPVTSLRGWRRLFSATHPTTPTRLLQVPTVSLVSSSIVTQLPEIPIVFVLGHRCLFLLLYHNFPLKQTFILAADCPAGCGATAGLFMRRYFTNKTGIIFLCCQGGGNSHLVKPSEGAAD